MSQVLIFGPAPSASDAGLTEAIAAACARRGYAVWRLPHLYHLPAAFDMSALIEEGDAPLACFAWLYPRPATWLLRARGVTAPIHAFNLAEITTPEEALACLQDCLPLPTGATPEVVQVVDVPVTERWYPVVDADTCVNCRHCLQFCLFGVYTDPADRVTVTAPDKCKPGCPACSRICPHGAIMFPRYAKDPAIAGAPGTWMQPDPAARAMFYARTKLPCPVCGQEGPVVRATDDVPCCEECGRPRPAGPDPIRDEIDALLDALDDLTQRSN